MKRHVIILIGLVLTTVLSSPSAQATTPFNMLDSKTPATNNLPVKAPFIAPVGTVTTLFPAPAGAMDGNDTNVAYLDSSPVFLMARVEVYPAFGRTFTLQRKDGDVWTDTQTFATDEHTMTANVDPIVTRPTEEIALVEYRIYSPATAYDAEFVSTNIRVTFQNYATYDDQRQNVANIIRNYCPDYYSKIYYASPTSPVRPFSGIYDPDTEIIAIVDGLDEDQVKHVALHECAHHIQNLTFGIDDTKMEKALYPVYGDFAPGRGTSSVPGIEQNAECMAFFMGSPLLDAGYLSKADCVGQKEVFAKTVISGQIPKLG